MQVSITNVLSVPAFSHPVALTISCAGEHVNPPVNTDDGVVGSGAIFNLLLKAECEKNGLADDRQAPVAKSPIGNLFIKTGRSGEWYGLHASVYGPDRQSRCRKRNVSSALPTLEHDGLRLKDGRGLQNVFVGPGGSVHAANVSDARLGDLGGETVSLSYLVGQRVQLNCVTDASFIKSDATHRITGFCPCLYGALRRVERHVYFELDGSDYFQHGDTLRCVLEEINDKTQKGVRIPLPAKAGSPLREDNYGLG